MSTIDPQDDPLTGAAEGQLPASEQKKIFTFTILHTDDMHSNLIGVGPRIGILADDSQRRRDDRRY
jgi:hypothetical protein